MVNYWKLLMEFLHFSITLQLVSRNYLPVWHENCLLRFLLFPVQSLCIFNIHIKSLINVKGERFGQQRRDIIARWSTSISSSHCIRVRSFVAPNCVRRKDIEWQNPDWFWSPTRCSFKGHRRNSICCLLSTWGTKAFVHCMSTSLLFPTTIRFCISFVLKTSELVILHNSSTTHVKIMHERK